MPDIEWERFVFNIGDAKVTVIREYVKDEFYDDYDDFFNKFD